MSRSAPRRQLAGVGYGLVVVYGVLLAGFVAVGVLSRVLDFKVGTLTRDPTQLSGRHPLVGAVSNLGALAWCTAAAVCLFTWTMVRRSDRSKLPTSFFLWSGLLSAFLLIDDLFRLHDDLLPFRVGIPENLVFAIYGAGLVVYVWRFREAILNTDWGIFALAVLFGGFSLALDVGEYFTVAGVRLRLPMHVLVEDAFKFTAIVTWAVYYWRVCAVELGTADRDPGASS